MIKQSQKKLSVGFGPWRQEASRSLRAAAVKGEFMVYVVAEPRIRSKDRTLTNRSLKRVEPTVVPVNVLRRLISPRGALPDHPIRPSMETAEGDEKLFALLTVGLLVVRASDFDIWYRSERAKGKWPSQRSKLKVRDGRPSIQTEALRNAVLALVHDLKWNGKDGIMSLHRLLVASRSYKAPSPDNSSGLRILRRL